MRSPPSPALLGLTAAAFMLAASAARVTAQPLDVEVPFVVSPPAVTKAMLEMAQVTAKDFVLDLGSGDGRIVILAARQFGARGLGVEIDPRLVLESRANAEKAGVAARVAFREDDLFKTDLGVATVITMYLLPDVNLALRPKILKLAPGTRIVSHDWDMGDWAPDEVRVVDHPEKTVGIEKTSKVLRWTVPADVGGAWCAMSDVGAVQLRLEQRYQKVEGTMSVTASVNKAQKTRDVVRFRATMSGSRFAIPHPARDAEAVLSGRLTLDARPYGFEAPLQFTRGACPSARLAAKG